MRPAAYQQFALGDLERERREFWLAGRLVQHGVKVFEGVTDRALRKERIRAGILEQGLAQVICGRSRNDRKPFTYSEAFERLYGEPLQPTQSKQGE